MLRNQLLMNNIALPFFSFISFDSETFSSKNYDYVYT